MGYYYPERASAYAVTWADRRNPAYRDFTGGGQGGDCTNFTAQCLQAGGWPMLTGDSKSLSTWYYKDSSEQSISWVFADSFAWFCQRSDRTSQLWGPTEIDDRLFLALRPGDVVQQCLNGSTLNDVHHSMFVITTGNLDSIRFAQHSGSAPVIGVKRLKQVRDNPKIEDKFTYLAWRPARVFVD